MIRKLSKQSTRAIPLAGLPFVAHDAFAGYEENGLTGAAEHLTGWNLVKQGARSAGAYVHDYIESWLVDSTTSN